MTGVDVKRVYCCPLLTRLWLGPHQSFDQLMGSLGTFVV